MAVSTLKCNHLTPLCLKGLNQTLDVNCEVVNAGWAMPLTRT